MAKYDKEKCREEQKRKKQEIYNQLKDISDNFKSDPNKIAEFLAFSSKFYKYSPNNTKLIYQQNQHADFVGSFQFFKEKGYNVLKGEKALRVLVPVITTYFQDDNDEWKKISEASDNEKAQIKKGQIDVMKKMSFKLGSVFEIAQTDCPVEDYPKIFNMGYSSEEHALAFEHICNYSKTALSCPVDITNLQSISLRGAFYPFLNKIELNDKLNDTEKLSTLCHELGHAIIHNDKSDKWEDKEFQRELEADMFGIMLQNYVGVELTDTRKKHFTDHYRKLEQFNNRTEDEEKQINFDEMLSDVFSIYENCITGINQVFEQSQGKETVQKITRKEKEIEV